MIRAHAGLFRNRVYLQKRTSSTNAFGEAVDSWSRVATVWAEIDHTSGSERFTEPLERGFTAALFRVRFRNDVDEADYRLAWPSTSDVWDIESVQNTEGRRKVTEILAVRRG